MNTAELTALLDRLRAEPRESEWLEFKANRYEPQALGEYLSALANSACLLGKPRGYLVFGVEDGSHAVVGTTFDPLAAKGNGNQLLPLWLSLGLQPNVGFEIYPFTYRSQRVVLFEVHPAFDRPVKFYGTAFVRDGTSKTELPKYPEKERAIWARRVDWSPRYASRQRRRTIWTRRRLSRLGTSMLPSSHAKPRNWRNGTMPPFSTRPD